MKRIVLLLSLLTLAFSVNAQVQLGSRGAAPSAITQSASGRIADADSMATATGRFIPSAAKTQTAGNQPNKVTGFYAGTLYQPRNSAGIPTFQFEMTLVEDSSGNVLGESRSAVYGTSYYIKETISGQVSNGLLLFQQTGTVAQNPIPGGWCAIAGQLGVSGNGDALSGQFQAGNDCSPGSISLARSDGRLIGAANHPGTCICADPININSGNVHEEYVDYQTYGRYSLSFIRYYNSRALSTAANELGTNWRSNLDRYLYLSSASVVAERPDGEQITFTLTGSKWVSNTDVDVTLAQVGTTWLLTDGDDTVESYSQASPTIANLQSIRLRNGYKQTLSYNASNQVEYLQDSFYNTIGFSYQSNGLLSRVSTPEGTSITYGYASSSGGPNLMSATFSGTPQQVVTFAYESTIPNALTRVVDENGNTYATWTYDQFGRGLTNQVGGEANLVQISYDDATSARTVTNSLGVSDVYKFTTLQGLPKITEIDRQATATTAAAVQTFVYDANGYLSGKTDWNGNTTTYINNAHGQPQTVTEAFGTPVSRTTAITYDPVWSHLASTIATPGLTTAFKYDSASNLQSKTLTDTTGNATSYSTTGTTRTWTYGWLNFLPVSITGPRTDLSTVTKYGYDRWGALVLITNPLGQQTKITQHTGGGRPQTVVDSNGVTTRLIYDSRQRLTGSTVSTAAGSLATTYVFDPAGNLASVTKPDGSTLTNQYDAAHRLTRVTDSLGNYISYTLDSLGDRLQEKIFKNDGTLAWQRSGTFDALGRLQVSTEGAGQTTTQTFDPNGNLLSVVDGLKHKTVNVYDALNRISISTDASGGVTKTAFDAYDRVVSVTDANNNTTSYLRDGFGDVIQRVSPDSGTAVLHYDPDGNVTSKTDAMNIVTNQTFDALDRPLTRTYPASPAESVSFTYDQAVSGVSFGKGKLTSVTDQAGSETRQYDERGNLTREQRTNGSSTLTTSYSYDKASRVASMTYPDGTLIGYQHNAAGYTSQVTAKLPGSSASVTLATLDHQPFGPLGSVTYGNGTAENWTFDQSYRPNQIVDALSGASVQNLAYKYDAANNVQSITDAVNAANSQTFGYDPLDRLSSAVSGSGGYGTFSWAYDKVGNRLTQTRNGAITTYTYAPGTNRLATISPIPTISAVNSSQAPVEHGALPVQTLFSAVMPLLGSPAMPTGPPIAVNTPAKLTHSYSLPLSTQASEWRPRTILHTSSRTRGNRYPSLTQVAYSPTGDGVGVRGIGSAALGIRRALGPISNNLVIIPAPPQLPPIGTFYAPFLFSIPVDPYTRIYYTVNGATPTTGSYLYTGPFWVGSSLLFRAIAVSTLAGGGSSSIASGQYLFTTAPPAFSLAGGSYNSYQTLGIFEATPGATVYYTTDRSTPTNNSPQYTGPISIQRTQTVNAVAALGNVASTLTSATYTIALPSAAAPVFSPTGNSYLKSQTVTISDATPGATIYYTVDGSAPTTASLRYTGALTVTTSQTISAVAVASGFNSSPVASASYTNTALPLRPLRFSSQIVTPIPSDGSSPVFNVTISEPIGGSYTIFYTVDGTTPTTASAKYTRPIMVPANTLLKAFASAQDWNTSDSPVGSVTFPYSVTPTPTLSPAGGVFSGTQWVTVSDTQPRTTFYYTTDGTTPTTASGMAVGPIRLTSTATLKVIGLSSATGYYPSAVASASYVNSSQSTASVTTNANGNITSIPPANSTANATFSYNNVGRLKSVVGSPTAASFLYDYAGQRFSKTDGGTPPAIYSYAQGGTLIAENDGGTVTDYVYVDGRPLAQIQPGATPVANQVSYVLADRLGTPQRLINSSGAVAWSTTYQPFGTTGTVNATVNQNLRLPGQYADFETGFSYNHFRDYMPNLGRYLEVDPIGLRGGMNPYSYVANNPLALIDPKGTQGYFGIPPNRPVPDMNRLPPGMNPFDPGLPGLTMKDQEQIQVISNEADYVSQVTGNGAIVAALTGNEVGFVALSGVSLCTGAISLATHPTFDSAFKFGVGFLVDKYIRDGISTITDDVDKILFGESNNDSESPGSIDNEPYGEPN